MTEGEKMIRNDVANTSGENKEAVIDIRNIPEHLETSLRKELCLYKVPPALRKKSETSYTPQVITIGPIHYLKLESTKDMELLELRYVKKFCKRLKEKTNKEFLSHLWNKVSEDKTINNICRCYHPDTSKISNFTNMILADAIFILELFMRNHNYLDHPRDFIMSKPWLRNSIRQDLILLENQLPYFFLEEMYNDCKLYFSEEKIPHHDRGQGQGSEKMKFLDLTYEYFKDYKPKGFEFHEPTDKELYPREKIKHFTDLVRYFWCFKFVPGFGVNNEAHDQESEVPDERVNDEARDPESGLSVPLLANESNTSSGDQESQITDESSTSRGDSKSQFINGERVKRLPCLTKLQDAGVKLKRNGNNFSIAINFHSGELQIPNFEINDSTESVVRNVMAFEQCHYPNETYVCSYIMFMDFLIDTSTDVDLLLENEIIVNELGDSKAVADMINKLCLQITEVRSCYISVASKLTTYHENRCNRAMAILKSVYFPNVWRGTGTIAAAVLLILTFITTIHSILSL